MQPGRPPLEIGRPGPQLGARRGNDMGANDAFLQDAYSRTVSEVVERVGPSVASVRLHGAGGPDERLGGRSGLL